jgi:predicted transposase YbfD/YdcC
VARRRAAAIGIAGVAGVAGTGGGRQDLRGSGTPGYQVHLLAVMDHASTVVLNQVSVPGKTNEITRFKPLLHGLDLTNTVITADAMHTQRDHVDYLVTVKQAAYLLIVNATSPAATTSSRPSPGASRSPTRPANNVTEATRSAACRSPP